MSHKSRVGIIGLAVLIVIPLSGSAQKVPNKDHGLRAAAVLFDQYETVFYAENRLLAGSGSYRGIPKRHANQLRAQFAYLLGGLDALGERAPSELLRSGEAFFGGTKDFRPPKGLGLVRSQFCYVVVLASGGKFELNKYSKEAPATFVDRVPVWNWSAKLGEFGEDDPRASSLYATQILSSYLVVSNNLEDLKSVVERLNSAKDATQTLNEIQDWDSVRQRSVWAYRRYRHTGVVNRMAAGMDVVTPGAKALSFFVDSQKKSGTLRLISAPDDQGTSAKMNAQKVLPPLKPQGPGIWETIIPLKGDEDSFDRLFVIMGLLGFGMYL